MLDEPGTDQARKLFGSATWIQSSRLLVPEAHAALARARRDRRYDRGGWPRARELLRWLLNEVQPIELTEGVAERAGELAESLGLRGSDAVHLASYEGAAAEGSVFVAADSALARAATSLGHAVAVPGG